MTAQIKLTRMQWLVFLVLLVANAGLAFLTFVLGLHAELLPGQPAPAELPDVSAWVLGLANAALILVAYGALGAVGIWLGHKAGLPGVYCPGAGWRDWVWTPLLFGLVVGCLMVAGDRVFAILGNWQGLVHPAFPLSLIASVTAGIGEEIVFRGFVMGVWAFLLTRFLKGPRGTKGSLWIANVLAALAFAAGHLPAAMMVYGAQSPLELPLAMLAEMLVLNCLVALVAGERYMRSGLVAAMGVHFWADIVWHVLWPWIAGP
jgi:membrane protease YdiL (CAAX protease family)